MNKMTKFAPFEEIDFWNLDSTDLRQCCAHSIQEAIKSDDYVCVVENFKAAKMLISWYYLEFEFNVGYSFFTIFEVLSHVSVDKLLPTNTPKEFAKLLVVDECLRSHVEAVAYQLNKLELYEVTPKKIDFLKASLSYKIEDIF